MTAPITSHRPDEHIGVNQGPLSRGTRCCECWGDPERELQPMSIIPLHLQRRFEQRWAARFGSLVIPAVPMPSRHGRLSYPIGPAETQRRDRRWRGRTGVVVFGEQGMKEATN